MSAIKVVLVIIGIFVLITIVQNGMDKAKSQPFQSAIDTGQSIIGTGKDVYDTGKEMVEEEEVVETNKSLGRPKCDDDRDCDTIQQCFNNCRCENHECYKNVR